MPLLVATVLKSLGKALPIFLCPIALLASCKFYILPWPEPERWMSLSACDAAELLKQLMVSLQQTAVLCTQREHQLQYLCRCTSCQGPFPT